MSHRLVRSLPRPLSSAAQTYGADLAVTDDRSLCEPPTVTVTTLAGNGEAGFRDGDLTAARFHGPDGVAVDASGNVYVTDVFNQRVRRITPSGHVSTLAPGVRFKAPEGLAVDAMGNLYVADGGMCIWRITPAGDASVLKDQHGRPVEIYFPEGLAVDANGTVYGADSAFGIVRTISAGGVVSAVKDAAGHAVHFDFPSGVAVDAEGNVYVAEQMSNRVRKVSPSGCVSTLKHADGSDLAFDCPDGLALDGAGNLCVVEVGRHRLLRITPAGAVTILAGGPIAGFQDGDAERASFNTPLGVAVGPDGALYVADSHNHRIRRIR